MNTDVLTLGGIIGVGALVTSLVIGSEVSTYATMLEPNLYINSEGIDKMASKDYFLKNSYFPSFQYDHIRIGMDIEEKNYPEINVIEVPVVKKMVFQFNKPVKLEFS